MRSPKTSDHTRAIAAAGETSSLDRDHARSGSCSIRIMGEGLLRKTIWNWDQAQPITEGITRSTQWVDRPPGQRDRSARTEGQIRS
jgi:hypothetical protein